MPTTIVVAGKGGTGKTTVAALLIQLLSQKGVVLAIDADPATNLHQALGVPLGDTVGRIREDMTDDIKRGTISPTMSKQEYLDQKIMAALVELKGFDLLAMGRPEGPGCYCAANNMLRLSIDRLGQRYSYVVIDSEAGMEHISRQTTRDIDILLIMSDVTQRGINTAAAMKGLIKELRTQVGKVCLVVNRSANGLPPEIVRSIDSHGFELVATIPQDTRLADLEVKGLPVTQLPLDSSLRIGVRELASKVGLWNEVDK
ncbi:MAG: carbon monoxide dehydrogenase [Chloroflexi bacterium]|nr:carbon monoxide dehydrogenase [Chloroflexota bacterium]